MNNSIENRKGRTKNKKKKKRWTNENKIAKWDFNLTMTILILKFSLIKIVGYAFEKRRNNNIHQVGKVSIIIIGIQMICVKIIVVIKWRVYSIEFF